jgi:hypothetical protein
MQKLPDVAKKTGALASALATHLSAARTAYTTTQKFDYNANYRIDTTDGYVDLGDFSQRIKAQSIGVGITAAAQAVITALGNPQTGVGLVVALKTVSSPSQAGSAWDLSHATGLSIYMPLGERDCRPTGLESAISTADAPCSASAQSLGARLIFQFRYYADPLQLAFTRDVPQWATLLSSLLDTTTIDKQSPGSFGLPLPGVSKQLVFIPMMRQ